MRLDAYLYSIGKFVSRTKAAEAVVRGEVLVNGVLVKKVSYGVTESDDIKIVEGDNFVSNGGYKLEKAIKNFNLSVKDLSFVDIGASTGGFTDCLLRCGAKEVTAIDVGESLLSEKLKNDKRVRILDNFNARGLSKESLGYLVDGVVCDVSFISLTYVLKPIYEVLKQDGIAITLIKPQFECGKKALNKNGIVTSSEDRKKAVEKIYSFGAELGLTPVDFTVAPKREGKNIEYLMLWEKCFKQGLDLKSIQNII